MSQVLFHHNNPVWLIFTITLLSHFTEKRSSYFGVNCLVLIPNTFFLSLPEHSSQPGFPNRLKAAQTEHLEQTLHKLYVSWWQKCLWVWIYVKNSKLWRKAEWRHGLQTFTIGAVTGVPACDVAEWWSHPCSVSVTGCLICVSAGLTLNRCRLGVWPGLSCPAGHCLSPIVSIEKALRQRDLLYASSTMSAFISIWWDICILKSSVVEQKVYDNTIIVRDIL